MAHTAADDGRGRQTSPQSETLSLAKQLIACRSVTPDDAGSLALGFARR